MITTPIKKTYQDYIELPDEFRSELIEGELLMTPSPIPFHQKVLFRLAKILAEHVAVESLGEVYISPLDVVLSNQDVVQPDILFISQTTKQIVTDVNIKGVPDLIVEVISPSSKERDRFIKKALYLKFGVSEYWLVDLEKRCVEILSLADNEYKLIGIFLPEDSLSTPLFPGLNLSVDSLFKAD